MNKLEAAACNKLALLSVADDPEKKASGISKGRSISKKKAKKIQRQAKSYQPGRDQKSKKRIVSFSLNIDNQLANFKDQQGLNEFCSEVVDKSSRSSKSCLVMVSSKFGTLINTSAMRPEESREILHMLWEKRSGLGSKKIDENISAQDFLRIIGNLGGIEKCSIGLIYELIVSSMPFCSKQSIFWTDTQYFDVICKKILDTTKELSENQNCDVKRFSCVFSFFMICTILQFNVDDGGIYNNVEECIICLKKTMLLLENESMMKIFDGPIGIVPGDALGDNLEQFLIYCSSNSGIVYEMNFNEKIVSVFNRIICSSRKIINKDVIDKIKIRLDNHKLTIRDTRSRNIAINKLISTFQVADSNYNKIALYFLGFHPSYPADPNLGIMALKKFWGKPFEVRNLCMIAHELEDVKRVASNASMKNYYDAILLFKALKSENGQAMINMLKHEIDLNNLKMVQYKQKELLDENEYFLRHADYMLGIAYYLIEDYKTSQAFFIKSKKPESKWMLGLIHEQANHFLEALGFYEKAYHDGLQASAVNILKILPNVPGSINLFHKFEIYSNAAKDHYSQLNMDDETTFIFDVYHVFLLTSTDETLNSSGSGETAIKSSDKLSDHKIKISADLDKNEDEEINASVLQEKKIEERSLSKKMLASSLILIRELTHSSHYDQARESIEMASVQTDVPLQLVLLAQADLWRIFSEIYYHGNIIPIYSRLWDRTLFSSAMPFFETKGKNKSFTVLNNIFHLSSQCLNIIHGHDSLQLDWLKTPQANVDAIMQEWTFDTALSFCSGSLLSTMGHIRGMIMENEFVLYDHVASAGEFYAAANTVNTYRTRRTNIPQAIQKKTAVGTSYYS